MRGSEFYLSNNTEKYPDRVIPICKKCLTMHVDNWNPDTYLWILQEVDVPYIPEQWNKLLAAYGKDRSKVTGMTILGRYLATMKIKQYKDWRWKDTEFLQQQANNKIEETMKRQGYSAQEIAETINKASFPIPEKPLEIPDLEADTSNPYAATGDEDYFAEQGESDDLGDELTEEDRIYLRLKWGKAYKPEEWIKLEQLYQEMMESYDIQTAGHIDTLKMVCKTSLKTNQLLDIGDIDGAQKASKMYDMLMKSGKFTAAQNKAESGEYVDSISELVAICEKDGFIPRYYTEGPQDKVDRTLEDLQKYTRSLVMEEMNLGTMIEKSLRQIEKERETEEQYEAEAADDDEALEAELFDNQEVELSDDDFRRFSELAEEDEEADDNYLKSLLEEGEL